MGTRWRPSSTPTVPATPSSAASWPSLRSARTLLSASRVATTPPPPSSSTTAAPTPRSPPSSKRQLFHLRTPTFCAYDAAQPPPSFPRAYLGPGEEGLHEEGGPHRLFNSQSFNFL